MLTLQHKSATGLTEGCYASCSLVVNLGKSKVMVFREGGPLCKNDKWSYKGKSIEVVNSYR